MSMVGSRSASSSAPPREVVFQPGVFCAAASIINWVNFEARHARRRTSLGDEGRNARISIRCSTGPNAGRWPPGYPDIRATVSHRYPVRTSSRRPRGVRRVRRVENLFGDILSDLGRGHAGRSASRLPTGIDPPSACSSLFEPGCATANIAGKGIVKSMKIWSNRADVIPSKPSTTRPPRSSATSSARSPIRSPRRRHRRPRDRRKPAPPALRQSGRGDGEPTFSACSVGGLAARHEREAHRGTANVMLIEMPREVLPGRNGHRRSRSMKS